jgi:hypothetical protein
MATNGPSLGSYVVVVGDPSSALVQTTMQWAREGELDAVACDNVYAAMTRIAQAGSRRILAVGTIQELTREKDAFFRVMAAHVIPCCCLLDKTGPVERKDLLAVVEFAVRLLDDVADVRSVLEEWRATPPPRGEPRVAPASSGRRRNDVADTSYEEFRATEAELSALLG